MQPPLNNLEATISAFLLEMREKGFVATLVLLDMDDPERYKFGSTVGDEKAAIELLRMFVEGMPRAENKTVKLIKTDGGVPS